MTRLGTTWQVLAGVVGVDAPADARDLSADFVNWEWAWKHAGQTGVDLLAIFPLVGLVKYADEALAVGKQLVKNADEVEPGIWIDPGF